jgi:hypothetical protein
VEFLFAEYGTSGRPQSEAIGRFEAGSAAGSRALKGEAARSEAALQVVDFDTAALALTCSESVSPETVLNHDAQKLPRLPDFPYHPQSLTIFTSGVVELTGRARRR